MPRVQAFSTRLLALVRVNRAAHMPTYRRLIREEATQPEGAPEALRDTLAISREAVALVQRYHARR